MTTKKNTQMNTRVATKVETMVNEWINDEILCRCNDQKISDLKPHSRYDGFADHAITVETERHPKAVTLKRMVS